MNPTYPTYPIFLELCDNLGDFNEDFHYALRDRMREIPPLLGERSLLEAAADFALETFTEHHYLQLGPYHNVMVHVGFSDISIDLDIHCRTILQPCNREPLAKLLTVLNAVTGAVCVRFIYGPFEGDCTIAQWNFSRNSWTFHKPKS
jgi:hypothetical protein